MDNALSMKQESEILKDRVNKNLLYIAIFSIVMLFAGLTSAYIVRQADGMWLRFTLPFYFWISTGLILASSATMAFALNSARNNRLQGIKTGLALTFILGVGFCFAQIMGWRELYDAGIFFSGKSSNPSGSFLYVITFMHLLHIVSGLLYVLFIFIKSLNNKYNSSNLTGLKHSSLYWHFLDALWIYLFIFLLFMQ